MQDDNFPLLTIVKRLLEAASSNVGGRTEVRGSSPVVAHSGGSNTKYFARISASLPTINLHVVGFV